MTAVAFFGPVYNHCVPELLPKGVVWNERLRCPDTTGEANVGNDQTVAVRQRRALEALFYAGGTENHVDAVFYGAHAPDVRGVRQSDNVLRPMLGTMRVGAMRIEGAVLCCVRASDAVPAHSAPRRL